MLLLVHSGMVRSRSNSVFRMLPIPHMKLWTTSDSNIRSLRLEGKRYNGVLQTHKAAAAFLSYVPHSHLRLQSQNMLFNAIQRISDIKYLTTQASAGDKVRVTRVEFNSPRSAGMPVEYMHRASSNMVENFNSMIAMC